MELPVAAQLSSGTSTFNGNIAATCSISLPQNIPLEYQPSNSLEAAQNIEITANFGSPRLTIDRLTVVEEPPPEGQTIFAEVTAYAVYGNTITQLIASKDQGSLSEVFSVTSNVPFSLPLYAFVFTSEFQNGRWLLPSGNYSYRTTITCLQ